MTACDLRVEYINIRPMYFAESPTYDFNCELMTLTEDLMNKLQKEARIKAKLYVHPDMVDKFLTLLANNYHEEITEAIEICNEIGLSRRHMFAIREDRSDLQEELEEDFRNQAEEERYNQKEFE